MFRVFSRFNALFVRPKIRGAIQEYQTNLIDSVKSDISQLHTVFRSGYKGSSSYHMAQLRDVSPIAGAIIWAKQIERQLNTYMKRVEDVLGKGWELYAEGAKLASESLGFRRKLDTRPIYEAWLHEINRRDMQIQGRLFEIGKSRSLASINGDSGSNAGLGLVDAEGGAVTPGAEPGVTYSLGVNFDPQIITLFKEVRNLLWLGFSVPHAIGNIAKDAKRVYPLAVSLVSGMPSPLTPLCRPCEHQLTRHALMQMETLRTYQQTVDKVHANPGILVLVAEYRKDVQQMITKGMSLRWEFFVNTFDTRQSILPAGPNGAAINGSADLLAREGRHGAFVRELASAVSMFQDRTDALLDMSAEIGTIVQELATCKYESSAFGDLLTRVQRTIDKLNLEGYANLESWVQQLGERIEEILLQRLNAVIEHWCTEITKDGRASAGSTVPRSGKGSDSPLGNLQVVPVKHELRIRNQVIYLDPPLEAARMSWYAQLQSWLGVICNLQRIQSSRYDGGLSTGKPNIEDVRYVGLVCTSCYPTLA